MNMVFNQIIKFMILLYFIIYNTFFKYSQRRVWMKYMRMAIYVLMMGWLMCPVACSEDNPKIGVTEIEADKSESTKEMVARILEEKKPITRIMTREFKNGTPIPNNLLIEIVALQKNINLMRIQITALKNGIARDQALWRGAFRVWLASEGVGLDDLDKWEPRNSAAYLK